MNFTVKVYPQVIWGEKYQGNFEKLADDIKRAGIGNIVVTAFQGSRIFFSQPTNESDNPWSLLPLKKLCRERSVGFALEMPIFHDRDSFSQLDNLRPQSPNGETYPDTSWYRPICPSHENFAQFRLQFIEKALQYFEPSLVTLNFLWYPFWPEGSDWTTLGSQATSFCFCDACRTRFSASTGLINAAQDVEAWFAFRTNVLSDFLADVEELTQHVQPPPSLILEMPPVPTPYTAERLRRLTGIHLLAWQNLVQVLSPQLFYHQCGQSLEWAAEVLDELQGFGYSLFPQIDLPHVSAYKQEMRTELHAFLDSLETAGIGALMLYSWETLRDLPDIIQLMPAFNS